MNIIILVLFKTIILVISVVLYGCFHVVDGYDIVEIGYRSSSAKKRIRQRMSGQARWDYYTYWSLCKNAKKNHKAVWLYFGIHLVLCFAFVLSILMWIIALFWNNWRHAILAQLIPCISSIMIWGLIHMMVDKEHLPSEQLRYGIKK